MGWSLKSFCRVTPPPDPDSGVDDDDNDFEDGGHAHMCGKWRRGPLLFPAVFRRFRTRKIPTLNINRIEMRQYDESFYSHISIFPPFKIYFYSSADAVNDPLRAPKDCCSKMKIKQQKSN